MSSGSNARQRADARTRAAAKAEAERERRARRRRLQWVSGGALLGLVIAGVTGWVLLRPGDEPAAAGTGGTAGNAGDHERMLEFAQCMRDHGVDMPDPEPGGPVQLRVPPGPEGEAAMEACRHLAPNGGEAPEYDADGMAALRDFTECMRENGVDMPDPAADGALSMPEGVNPQGPEVQDAMEQCRELMAGYPVRIGPPR